MGCVERQGYPECYGAICRNDGCTCPPEPRGPDAARIVQLEARVEQLTANLIELTEALIERGIIPDCRP